MANVDNFNELGAPVLLHMSQTAFAFAPTPLGADFTADFTNDEIDHANHQLRSGDGPVQLTTTTTLPAGLDLLQNYWVSVVDGTAMQLHLTQADALAGSNPVGMTDAGTGTHTMTPTADISGWNGLVGTVDEVEVEIDASGAETLTAGVLWIKDADDIWYIAKTLLASITLASNIGHYESAAHSGRAVQMGLVITGGATNVTVRVRPVLKKTIGRRS